MNVQWFPGHMVKALKEIYEKQKMVDMIIEIVDSRAPLSSRNPELVNINKPRLIIMSKKDYADITGMSQTGISYRCRKILSKLKLFLDIMGSFC